MVDANIKAIEERVSLSLFIENTKHELTSWYDNLVTKLCLLRICNR